ncbi:MAG: hypothetical protein HY319_25300 [Armatimonadetes bacterium]|nr:hypothetical protein [Armatimonadota bacterium]
MRKRLEELRSRGLLDEETLNRLTAPGPDLPGGGAVAVAVACGPSSKAVARSSRGRVEALAGPDETVVASSD